ncbi:MAG TPA: lytic transglycosylase domain-containing protein, partial [Geminicoccaceae bacterium]
PIPRWQTRGGFRVDRALVYAVVRAESAFEIEAESPRGALGLMQVMPDTGSLVAKGADLAYNGPDDLLQPEINLEVGQIWLRRLMRTQTVGDSLIHLVVAYNAGETRLKGWLDGELKGAPRQDPLLFIESVPIEESREYVKKVLANLWAYQARLGQPTPSLRALAENRWPSAGRTETTAGLPVRRQVASAVSAQKMALAAPAAVRPAAVTGAKKPAAGKVRSVVIRGKDVTVRRRAGVVAKPAKASAGSLGRVKWTGLARAR